jgi:hypothetical protein
MRGRIRKRSRERLRRATLPGRLVAMHYDMRPDCLGWTLFDVQTGRPVVWEDVPLMGVDLDAAHELIILLHRSLRPGFERLPRGVVTALADIRRCCALRSARRERLDHLLLAQPMTVLGVFR